MTITIPTGELRKYSSGEFNGVLDRNMIEEDDCFYLAAIFVDPQVIRINDASILAFLPSKSLRLYEVDDSETGYTHDVGEYRRILMNQGQVLDYELMSQLHTQKDAHVYLWLTGPYEDSDAPLEVVGSWFRDETYPDTFKEETHG